MYFDDRRHLCTSGLVQHQRAACGARDEIALPAVSTFNLRAFLLPTRNAAIPFPNVSEPYAATLDVQIRPEAVLLQRPLEIHVMADAVAL